MFPWCGKCPSEAGEVCVSGAAEGLIAPSPFRCRFSKGGKLRLIVKRAGENIQQGPERGEIAARPRDNRLSRLSVVGGERDKLPPPPPGPTPKGSTRPAPKRPPPVSTPEI